MVPTHSQIYTVLSAHSRTAQTDLTAEFSVRICGPNETRSSLKFLFLTELTQM